MELYLVPTPIGNLEDMTHRGVRILNEVDLILAEDTRTTAVLLQHYSISTPMQSYHMFNEHSKVAGVIKRLQSGQRLALVSDAGTPAISDPGFLLVREALQHDIAVHCLPGPTALIPALVQSGLPADRFFFQGFLPPKKGRQKKLEELAAQSVTVVLYESPYKLLKTLVQMQPYFGGQRQLSICRELTKKFETTFRGNLVEAHQFYTDHPPKGEFVLCIAPA